MPLNSPLSDSSLERILIPRLGVFSGAGMHPGFPLGRGDTDLRHGRFSAKIFVKTKEFEGA